METVDKLRKNHFLWNQVMPLKGFYYLSVDLSQLFLNPLLYLDRMHFGIF